MGGITGSPLFETAIGLVLVWFVTATLCSGIVELIATALGFRARHLWQGLGALLGSEEPEPEPAAARAARLAVGGEPTGEPLTRVIEVIPGVTPTTALKTRRVDAAALADALIVVDEDADGDDPFHRTQIGQYLARLPDTVRDDVERKRVWLERWIEGFLGGLSSAYRSRIRWWTAVVAVPVVMMLGLDAVGLSHRLYDDSATRDLVVAEAAQTVDGRGVCAEEPGAGEGDDASTTTTPTEELEANLSCAKEAARVLSSFRISRWQSDDVWPDGYGELLLMLLGFAASVGAVAAGASFWFDVLKRMMGLRKT
jgi:hypothetical protein